MVEYSSSEEQLNLTFHALADPNRRKIIALLRETQSLKVTDIAAAFEMSLNGVSKHLKVLERANLIERNKHEREHFISIHWQALQQPYEWLHFHHHFWSSRIDQLVDYVETNRRKKK